MTDESDWKFKMSLGKVPVVYLNSHVEFTQWHIALRRLVGGYNMVQNLMYSVPENRYDSFLKSFKETVAVKQEVKQSSSSSSSSSSGSGSSPPPKPKEKSKKINLDEGIVFEAKPTPDDAKHYGINGGYALYGRMVLFYEHFCQCSRPQEGDRQGDLFPTRNLVLDGDVSEQGLIQVGYSSY